MDDQFKNLSSNIKDELDARVKSDQLNATPPSPRKINTTAIVVFAVLVAMSLKIKEMYSEYQTEKAARAITTQMINDSLKIMEAIEKAEREKNNQNK